MQLTDMNKQQTIDSIKAKISELGFTITEQNAEKPWGGYFVISEEQVEAFAKEFFPNIDMETIRITKRLSPKILMVAPNQRLSWQYHFRRAELWKCIGGKVAVITSDDDVERNRQELTIGDIIKLKQGERHRLVGLDDWGIVAEIWQHTDANHLSDEEDIVRVQDDFGR